MASRQSRRFIDSTAVTGLVRPVLRFWWLLVGLAFTVTGFVGTVRDLHRSIWFWFFLALVAVVVGLTIEWYRLWDTLNNRQQILRGVARRVCVELDSMTRDLDRVEKAGRYDGFVPLPAGTWTAEQARFEHLEGVFGIVSRAYLKADAFNKDIAVRSALAKCTAIGVIPDDDIDGLRVAITNAKAALESL